MVGGFDWGSTRWSRSEWLVGKRSEISEGLLSSPGKDGHAAHRMSHRWQIEKCCNVTCSLLSKDFDNIECNPSDQLLRVDDIPRKYAQVGETHRPKLFKAQMLGIAIRRARGKVRAVVVRTFQGSTREYCIQVDDIA